jgi:hypothetical protein
MALALVMVMANELRSIPVTEMSERIAYQKKWLRDNKVRPQKRRSIRNYAKNGAQYRESLRDSSLFLRGIVHLSITITTIEQMPIVSLCDPGSLLGRHPITISA